MQEVCNSVSEDSGLNDALKLARRVENDGVVASAALELSGSWATTLHGDDGERVSVQSPPRLTAGGLELNQLVAHLL